MVRRTDRYAGNILLYEYLSTKRAPVFLNRNLERVLQVNQHILKYGNTNDFPGLNHNLRSNWCLPSHDNLDDIIQDSQESFVLEVHSIKLLESHEITKTSKSIRPSKKARTLHLKCAIEVKVWDVLSASERAKWYKSATLGGKDSDHGTQMGVQTESVNIRREELSTDPGSLAKARTMTATIYFKTDEDANEFNTYFVSKTRAQAAPVRKLTALWSDILDCPSGTVVLPLKGDGELELGLEVSMYWSSREESILTTHNRYLKSSVQASAYPSPPPGGQHDNLPKHELCFAYADIIIRRSDLDCPHCKRRPLTISDLRMHLQSVHDNFNYRCIDQGESDTGTHRWRFECEIADRNSDRRASHRADEPFDVCVVAPEEPLNLQRLLDGDDSFQQAARKFWTTNQRKGPKKTSVKAVLTKRPKPKLPEDVQTRPKKDRRKYPVPKAPPGVTFFRQITKRPLKEGEYISESDEEPDTKWMTLRKLAENCKDEQISAPAERFLEKYDKFMQEEHLQSDVHASDALIRFAREMGVWLWQDKLFDEFKAKVNDLLEENIITKEIQVGSFNIVEAQKPKTLKSSELSQRLAELDIESPENNRANSVDQSPELIMRNKEKGRAKITDTGFLTPITADDDADMRDASPGIAGDWQTSQQEEEPDKHSERAEPVPGRCLCGQDALPYPRISPVVVCNDIVSNNPFATLEAAKELTIQQDCVRLYFHLNCVRKRWKMPDPFDPNTRDWTCGDCQPMDN